MNQWKNELKKAFEAPAPLKKRRFLRRVSMPRMRVPEFLRTQIRYIPRWIWCFCAIIFIASAAVSALLPSASVWIVSAFTPLLALTIISESGRSECYEMAELEMATRFSLKSVTLARMGILGLNGLILLCLLIPVGLWNNGLSLAAGGLYIVTPFLLTTFTGLSVVRKYRGHKTMYACMGVSVCVSFLALFARVTFPGIYQESYLLWWAAAAFWLCVKTGKQYLEIIKQTEELAWNFS